MNIADIRTAIANTMADLNIRAYDYAPDSPQAPAAFVYPDPFNFHATFDGTEMLNMVVRLLVSTVAMQAGQQQLDGFISPDGTQSIPRRLEADPSLGGLVASTEVTRLRNYGTLTLPDGLRYLTAELLVSIYTVGIE